MRKRNTHSAPAVPRHAFPQRGSLVIYVVLALVALGLLSVAMTSFFSSSQMSTAQVNCPRQAEYLAESGVRYAMSQLRAASNVSLAQFNTTLTTLQTTSAYSVDGTGTFSLAITDASPQYTVTATGTACPNDGGVTATAGPVTFTINGAYCPGCGGGDPDTIAFEPDADGNSDVDKFPPAGTGGDDGDDMVQIDTDDNTISLGNGGYASYGCAWYTGNKSPCTNGVCEFGSGLRVYYQIMLSSNAEGDGYVFAIVNADNNTVNDCGGDVNMGELLAYAGSGNTGHGLRAPKLGLEFDFYDNTGSNSVCDVGNRGDTSYDHVAWLFWGQDYWASGCNETYDDNRHGAGVWTGQDGTPANADIPTNPENIGASGAGQDGYHYQTSLTHWIREYNSGNNGKKFRIRIEVDRSQTANSDGNYCYTLKGWIVKDSETMPEGMDDVSTDYYDPNDQATWPQVEHMVVLSPTKHGQFDDIIFGWTVATGGATQTITVSDLRAKFKVGETTCPATTKPADPVVALPLYEGMGGNVHNTANGISAYFQYAYWLKGRSCPECSAVYFDDAYGPITLWDDATNTMTAAGTVSAWVYLKSYRNYMGILHKGNETDFSDEDFSLQFTEPNFRVGTGSWRFNPDRTSGFGGGANFRIDNGNKKPLFCINDGAGILYCVNSQYELELETWYHLAATWDSTADVMEFFVNGVKTATFDPTDYGWNLPVVSNAWNEFIVGAQTGSQLSFQGMIDDVYLYDRVLTDDEIAALYSDGFLTAQEE